MNLEDVPDLPPWFRYPLVALLERHLLVEDFRLILKTQLDDDAPHKGEVPGRPGWEYRRIWTGWSVFNPQLQTSLDVVKGETGEVLDIVFAPNAYLTQPGVAVADDHSQHEDTPLVQAQRHASRWVPGWGPGHHVLEELIERGALARVGGKKVRLAPALLADLDSIGSLDDDSAFYDRLFREDDEEHRDAWRAWLLEIAGEPEHHALRFVHDKFDDEQVEAMVWKYLQVPPGEATLVALDVASERDLDIPPEVVTKLVRETDPLDNEGRTIRALGEYALPRDIATPLVVEKLVQWASGARAETLDLGEGLDEGLRNMLEMTGTTSMPAGITGLEEVASLLLEHSPEDALPVIRRALREDSVGELMMAMKLVALGQPWAIRELVEAMPEMNPLSHQCIQLALKARGHADALESAPDTESLADTFNPFDALDDDLGVLNQVLDGMLADPRVQAKLDEWGERVRAGFPDDFDPS